MRAAIEDVLSEDAQAEALKLIGKARFRDGKATAGHQARKVKENEQTDPADPSAQSAARLIVEALTGHPMFQIAARPARLSPLILSRYAPGMTYGLHVDDAVMRAPDGGKFRADVAFTVFLSAPESYEGGALALETSAGRSEIKLPAGAAIVYPADTLHEVTQVTDGVRLAAVGWAQSLIRDASARELLFDLEQCAMAADGDGAPRAALLARKAASNLLRRWAEP